MSNSGLVSYTRISPNRTIPRNHAIDRVTVHCTAGHLTASGLGSVFAPPSRRASCTYGIAKDGAIALICPESDRSWCSSNAANDHRAITIEVSSEAVHPYKVTEVSYKALLNLLTDICKRNGKTKLVWFGDKAKTLAYTPKAGEMVMTVHRWFANKACPGDYLYNRHGQIAEEVNKRLNAKEDPDMTEKETRKIAEEVGAKVLVAATQMITETTKGLSAPIIYKKFDDLPKEWGRATVQKLLDKDLLQGTGDGLNISFDLLRALVILDRAGVFDGVGGV